MLEGSKLFTRFQIGKMCVKNRIAIPPMDQYQATVEGLPTAWHKVHYGALAAGGAGLICIETTAVDPEGRISVGDLGLWDEEHENAFREIVDTMHAIDETVRVIVQLTHAGRLASEKRFMSGEVADKAHDGWEIFAPSPVAFGTRPVPTELDRAHIKQIVADFANAAIRAVRAGVHGVELHGAHGYLIHQFLSPISNHRTDEYGGSLENRMRFGLEVIEAVREAVPKTTLGIRVSATDWVEGGLEKEDVCEFLRRAQALGVEFADVSTGGVSPDQTQPFAYGYKLVYARYMKEQLPDLPIFGVGMIFEPEQADQAVTCGDCDIVNVGRAFLRNPHWGWYAALKLGAKVDFLPSYKRGMFL